MVRSPSWRDPCAELATLALVGCVAALLLLFADTDVARWRDARGLFAGDGFHSYGVTDEGVRYRDLLTNGTAPAIAGVLFGGLALLSFAAVRIGTWSATRNRAERAGATPDGRFDIAPLSLLVAVGLLSAAPSKWVYHFGSAAAIAALAIAVETVRVMRAPGRVGAWCRGGVALGATLATARALRHPRDAQYFLRLESPSDSLLWSVLGSPLVWIALAGLLLVAGRRVAVRRGGEGTGAAAWAVPGGLGAVAVLTAVTFALVPSVRGPHWAMGRTNAIDVLGGDCGFADRVDVSDPTEASVLAETSTAER